MTIAVCCVTPEGVVLGADSTSSLMVAEGFHYLNHNQKVFEIGQGATLGAVTWGMGSMGVISHRAQLAQLADSLTAAGITSVRAASNVWIRQFWPVYSNQISADLPALMALHTKNPYDPGLQPAPNVRTEIEEREYQRLRMGLLVGFCIGGYNPVDRQPMAYEIIFDPLAGPPTPVQLDMGGTRCWGAPKVFCRLVKGYDPEVKEAILASGKWTGSRSELDLLLGNYELYPRGLPIRDAVDFVHSIVNSTIKTLKFSHLSQTCGGPIELAVITADRAFRWVRHKDWDVAILEGQT